MYLIFFKGFILLAQTSLLTAIVLYIYYFPPLFLVCVSPYAIMIQSTKKAISCQQQTNKCSEYVEIISKKEKKSVAFDKMEVIP